MAKSIKKNTEGYGYKYADLAEVHTYLEANNMEYYQYIETAENGDDYIITVPIINGEEKAPRRGCRVVLATLLGKTNPAQEQGSALTYARRYSLLMAFGLATTDDDAEALTKPSTTKKISAKQAATIKALLEETQTDPAKFLHYFAAATVDDMEAVHYQKAYAMLKQKKEKEEARQNEE